MFIWDFLLGDVMDQIIDWFYGQLVGFLDFLLGDVMDQIIDWFYGQLVGFLADFFACAQHGQQLGGESPLRAW